MPQPSGKSNTCLFGDFYMLLSLLGSDFIFVQLQYANSVGGLHPQTIPTREGGSYALPRGMTMGPTQALSLA